MIELYDCDLVKNILDSSFNDLIKSIQDSKHVATTSKNCINALSEKWKSTEYGYRAVLRTTGLSCVNITQEHNGIRIVGEDELDGVKYSINILMLIPENIFKNIFKIAHKTVNGITFVDLYVEAQEKKKIKIEKL